MKNEIEKFLKHLEATEVYDEELEYTVWGAGNRLLSVTCCTNGARLVAEKFDGTVWGYYIPNELDEDFKEEYKDLVGVDCGGHDFAIVGKYLVDYWAHYINDPSAKPVLDLTNHEDIAYIQKKYLPLDMWVKM